MNAFRFWMTVAIVGIVGNASAEVTTTETTRTESPRSGVLEFKFGGYKPLIDRAASFSSSDKGPYQSVFGAGSMLLFELEGDWQLWQKFGSLGIGFSVGYAEKYAPALVAGSDQVAAERTALKVVPLKLMGVYRFDYAAQRWNVPLVPYVKAGVAYTPWWVTKGNNVEFTDTGDRAAGGKWGYVGVLGLSLLLDFFEPRLARDFDSDLGVNHSYLFAELVAQTVKYGFQKDKGWSSDGLNLSSIHWMFGLTLEY